MDSIWNNLVANAGAIAWYAVAAIVLVGVTYGFTAWLTGLQAQLRGRSQALSRFVSWLPVIQIGAWIVALLVGAFILSDAPTVVVFAFLIPLGLAGVIGSRDFARDAIAGAILAFEHTILAGDIVHVAAPTGEVSGRIVAIGVRRTLLYTNDGAEVFLPNQTLSNSIVKTNREHELDSPVEIEMPEFALDADVKALRSVAIDAAVCSRFASLRRQPEFFVKIGADGRERASLLAYAFSPEFVRHLESDVLEVIHDELKAGRA